VALARVCEARKTMYGLTPERNSCERIVSLDVERARRQRAPAEDAGGVQNP